MSAIDFSGRTIWITDAHRDGGGPQRDVPTKKAVDPL